jgi:phosphoenolpyruvate carboxylase
MECPLAKSDIAIASRYAELVSDSALREAIFGRLRTEWGESVRAVAGHHGAKDALEQNPLLARSIRNRFPYIDPLNQIQIELHRRHRAGATEPNKDSSGKISGFGAACWNLSSKPTFHQSSAYRPGRKAQQPVV